MMKYNIAGKLYPVAFNFNTMRKFMKSVGVDEIGKFDEIMADKPEGKITIQDLENRMELIHQAIIEGCRIEKQPCELSLDDLFLEMGNNPEMLSDMLAAFIETQPKPSEGDADKKKAEKP